MRKRIGSAGLGIRFLMERTCWEVYHCMTGSIHPEKGGRGVLKLMIGLSIFIWPRRRTKQRKVSLENGFAFFLEFTRNRCRTARHSLRITDNSVEVVACTN